MLTFNEHLPCARSCAFHALPHLILRTTLLRWNRYQPNLWKLNLRFKEIDDMGG